MNLMQPSPAVGHDWQVDGQFDTEGALKSVGSRRDIASLINRRLQIYVPIVLHFATLASYQHVFEI